MKNSAPYVSLIHDTAIFIVYVVKIGVPKDALGEKSSPLGKLPPIKIAPRKITRRKKQMKKD